MTNTIVRENRSNMFNGSLSKDEMMKISSNSFYLSPDLYNKRIN
jgi:hypothetical protein